MPPRFAYWTILIDNAPTAFRARDAQELLPTLAQLKRTNENVVLKWFSGGTLWDSPDAAREARRRPKVVEKRGADWRPGGQHRDPRARFDKKKPKRDRDQRPRDDRGAPPAQSSKPEGERRPLKPFAPGARKPWGGKPGGQRPWSGKPGGQRPWGGKPGGQRPSGGKPGGQRPWSGKPSGQRPWGGKPGGDRPRFSKPWQDRDRPQGGGGPRKPWQTKPGGSAPTNRWRGPNERSGPPRGPRGPRGPHKKRDDEE